MKKVLIAVIAIFMISGTAVATEKIAKDIICTNCTASNTADAIIAKLKSLTANYKNKISAARNVNELLAIANEYGEKSESLAYECNEAYENGLMTREELKKCEGAFYQCANEVSKAGRNRRAQLTRR